MNKKQIGRPDLYARDLKIAIAREYLKGELGYGKLGKKYGYSYNTIRAFVYWYKAHFPDPDGIEDMQVTVNTDESLSSCNKELSSELKRAHLKIAALEMLIENTNKELGYDIGKKGGTGQSAK